MNFLLLNAGSSSLKGTLMTFEGDTLARGSADWAGESTQYRFSVPNGSEKSETVSWKGHAAAVKRFLQDLVQTSSQGLKSSSLLAVGHRVVHGGEFRSAVRITPEVRRRIDGLSDLAPLHNAPSLEALTATEELLPNVPHVAVRVAIINPSSGVKPIVVSMQRPP